MGLEVEVMAIWKLVEQCARELTENGISPFTRADIISCVQSKNSSYGPDSINPIIQGVTDNLRGGAPGALGKDILHSVGRGLFVLECRNEERKNPVTRSSATITLGSSVSKKSNKQKQNELLEIESKETSVRIEGIEFRYVCTIALERNSDGMLRTFMPQDRFSNIDGIKVNKYGEGPFCKFKIPRNLEFAGVYALMEASELMYIGECASLSSRYNMGYGNISPRNCFVGGQETNCRINNLILQHVSLGHEISLWFFATANYKAMEVRLRASLSPRWNRA